MAARTNFQSIQSLVDRLAVVQGQFTVASGAVSAVQGNGVASVTHCNTGVYAIDLADSYNKFLGMSVCIEQPSDTPATIASGLTSGNLYTITTVGDASAADWVSVGLPVGVSPAVGVNFIASSTGSGNATTARVGGVIATSTADNLTINTQGSVSLDAQQAGLVPLIFRLGSTGAAANPPDGVVKFVLFFRNSTLKGKGE